MSLPALTIARVYRLNLENLSLLIPISMALVFFISIGKVVNPSSKTVGQPGTFNRSWLIHLATHLPLASDVHP